MGRWVGQPLSTPGSNACDSARAGGGEGAPRGGLYEN